MKKVILFFSIICCFSMSCGAPTPSSDKDDTPTSGKISFSVDETLSPIAEAQLDIFAHQNPQADITLRRRSEADCVRDLFDDSSKVIMIGRELTAEERASFRGKTFDPPTTKVCTDAVVLLVNPKNRDTTLLYDQLLAILRGQTATWQALGSNIKGDVTLVFDNANSGTVSYLLKMSGQTALPKNAFAAKSNPDVVNYVAEHENAIGIIGYSWVSDSDDPTAQQYLKKTRLVSLAPEGEKTFYKPFQQYLALKKYPLSRSVYMIERQRRPGLASGFTTFVFHEIGQTIILKAGLVPANQSDRMLEMKVKPIGKVSN